MAMEEQPIIIKEVVDEIEVIKPMECNSNLAPNNTLINNRTQTISEMEGVDTWRNNLISWKNLK
jgi:hypothetical protein